MTYWLTYAALVIGLLFFVHKLALSARPVELVARFAHALISMPWLRKGIELLSVGMYEAAAPHFVAGLLLIVLALKDRA